jgi:hypothetical protein
LHEISAFKPLKRFTPLTYFSSNFPKEFIDILEEDSNKHLMPSYHYNIARVLLDQQRAELALSWLRKATLREVEGSSRYEKIMRGEY